MDVLQMLLAKARLKWAVQACKKTELSAALDQMHHNKNPTYKQPEFHLDQILQ